MLDSPVFSDPQLYRLFSLCLMKAGHTARGVAIGGQKVQLEVGQFITGRDSLSDEYNQLLKRADRIASRTIWRWIKRLETWGCLSCKSSNQFTIITIVNWAIYQGADVESVQQIDHESVQHVSNDCPTGVQQLSTNKNVKNDKNSRSKDKKISYAEFVHMTEAEYQKLIDRLGVERTTAYIERLDNYKGAKGKRYRSDYRAILTWVNKDESDSKTTTGGVSNGTPIARQSFSRPTRKRDDTDDELDRIQDATFIS